MTVINLIPWAIGMVVLILAALFALAVVIVMLGFLIERFWPNFNPVIERLALTAMVLFDMRSQANVTFERHEGARWAVMRVRMRGDDRPGSEA